MEYEDLVKQVEYKKFFNDKIPLEYYVKYPKLITNVLSKCIYPGICLRNLSNNGIQITDDMILIAIHRHDIQALSHYYPKNGYSIKVLMAYYNEMGFNYELASYSDRKNGYYSQVKNELVRIEQEERKEKRRKFWKGVQQKIKNVFSRRRRHQQYKIIPTSNPISHNQIRQKDTKNGKEKATKKRLKIKMLTYFFLFNKTRQSKCNTAHFFIWSHIAYILNMRFSWI